MINDIRGQCDALRVDLNESVRKLRYLRSFIDDGRYFDAYPGQMDEVLSQTMLALRHCEDARMRVGKVLQYADNGTSIYDR